MQRRAAFSRTTLIEEMTNTPTVIVMNTWIRITEISFPA